MPSSPSGIVFAVDQCIEARFWPHNFGQDHKLICRFALESVERERNHMNLGQHLGAVLLHKDTRG